jgi:methionine-rich copper-binding protein CopC
MRWAMTVVLVAILVQRHLLVGTTAFWRTRPIPRASILASTLLNALFLTVIVPLVWFSGVFLGMRLHAPAALHAGLAIAGEKAFITGLALALASVSKNLAQIVVLGVVSLLAFVLGREVLWNFPHRPAPFAIALHTGEWVGIAFWTAVGSLATLIAVHQHLTLKTVRSLSLTAVLVVAVVLAARFPLWTVTNAPPAGAASRTLPAPRLSLDLESIRVTSYRGTNSGAVQPGMRYSATLADPTAGAIILKPVSRTTTIQFPDGVSDRSTSRFANSWLDDAAADTLAGQPYASVSAAIGGATIAEPENLTAGRYRFTFLEIGADTYAVRGAQPATVNVSLDLLAYRYAIVARVPLNAGHVARSPRYAVEFEGIAPVEDGVAVEIRETYVKDWIPIAPARYLLLNQKLHQAVVATARGESPFRSTLLDFSGMLLSRTRLEMKLSATAARQVTLNRAWLADAELIVLKPEALGLVSTSIGIDGFTLERPTKAPELR